MEIRKKVPSEVKFILKHFIWQFCHFHQAINNMDIFLFTSRRSGGTLLLEAICSSRGILYVTEPMETGKYDIWLKKKNIYPERILSNKGIPFFEKDEEFMKQFFGDIISGKIKIQQPWNFLDSSYHFFTNRTCIKMHTSKPWIRWFDDNFSNKQIVYLLRHPIPQSISAIRVGSILTTPVFLKDKLFVDEFISKDLLNFIYSILENGSKLEKYVLDWCVENLVPLRCFKNRPSWLVLTYEELVINPEKIAQLISRGLHLDDEEKVLKILCRSSKTVSSNKTKSILDNETMDETEKKAYLLRRWESSISADERESIFTILNQFGIDIYNRKDVVPASSLLHFNDSASKIRNVKLPENIKI